MTDIDTCAKETEEASELEMERQHYLKDLDTEREELGIETEGVDGEKIIVSATLIDYAPGSVAFHEAFHTAFVLYSMMESHIISHPSIFTDAESFAEAAKARDALWDLYQKLGAKHL
jgi:hypothetical protein